MSFGLGIPILDDLLGFAGEENLQDQAQGFNAFEAQKQRDFNSAEALKQREWAEDQAETQRNFQRWMSNSAVRRNMKDLRKAGLNPLLAVHPGGGASTPAGAMPSGAAATGAAATSPGAHFSSKFSQAMATASQISVYDAEADKLRAEAAEVRARTPRHEWDIEEIKARIPVHQEQVHYLRQQINESTQRIEKMYFEMQNLKSSAEHLDQQTANLKATIPLIRTQIDQLRALTAKNSAETEEIKQRIQENLPAMTRTLGQLEALRMRMAQPAQANQEAAADSFLGQMGAYLREINPLRGLLNATPR